LRFGERNTIEIRIRAPENSTRAIPDLKFIDWRKKDGSLQKRPHVTRLLDQLLPSEIEQICLRQFLYDGKHEDCCSRLGKLPIDLKWADFLFEAFADAIVALDSSVPTGTYVDMCAKLPVVDPEKITVPTIVMRGQWDGIASMEDLLAFFAKLPNPDKHFAVMPGIAHASFQQKNYMLVYHILASFFEQPQPIYRG